MCVRDHCCDCITGLLVGCITTCPLTSLPSHRPPSPYSHRSLYKGTRFSSTISSSMSPTGETHAASTIAYRPSKRRYVPNGTRNQWHTKTIAGYTDSKGRQYMVFDAPSPDPLSMHTPPTLPPTPSLRSKPCRRVSMRKLQGSRTALSSSPCTSGCSPVQGSPIRRSMNWWAFPIDDCCMRSRLTPL